MLLDLPLELIEDIFKTTAKSDVKSLRLVCRDWNDLASPFLYSGLFLSSHPLDNEVFSLVTANPLLCEGVRELVWDDSTLSEVLMDRKTYTKARLAHCGGNLLYSKLPVPDSELNGNEVVAEQTSEEDEAFKLFLDFSQKHHTIRRQRLDGQLLTKTLPKLKNLESIILTPIKHFDPRLDSPTARWIRNLSPRKSFRFPPDLDWSKVRHGPLDYMNTQAWLEKIRSPDYYAPEVSTNEWNLNLIDTNVNKIQRPARGLGMLLEALQSSGKTVKEFMIQPQLNSQNVNRGGISHWLFREPSSLLDAMTNIFASLRKLELAIGSEVSVLDNLSTSSVQDTATQGILAEVLSKARSLEELVLELPYMLAHEALRPQCRYAKLERLELRDCIVDPFEMLQFLERHAHTLQALHILNCDAERVSWDVMLYGLQTRSLCFAKMGFSELYDPVTVNKHHGSLSTNRGRQDVTKDLLEGFLLSRGPYPEALWGYESEREALQNS